MRLVRWEPWSDLENLLDNTPSQLGNMGWDLAVDVYEAGGKVIAKMQLPGVDPNKVEVSFEDAQHLRIAGTREEKQETKEQNYYSREIRQGSFERVVRLPALVDQESAEADLTDGVLKISMAKATDKGTEKIKVKINKK